MIWVMESFSWLAPRAVTILLLDSPTLGPLLRFQILMVVFFKHGDGSNVLELARDRQSI